MTRTNELKKINGAYRDSRSTPEDSSRCRRTGLIEVSRNLGQSVINGTTDALMNGANVSMHAFMPKEDLLTHFLNVGIHPYLCNFYTEVDCVQGFSEVIHDEKRRPM